MNAEKSLKLASRFIELPLEKRRLFLDGLRAENIDFSLFPIPAGIAAEDRQALSYAQRRMWFLWQMDPHSGAYNLPGAVRLRGTLSLAALEQAFASLVARHETLRTVFKRHADERLEQVAVETAVPVEWVDLSALAPDAREQAVADEAQRQSLQPFDLGSGPLLRVKLLKLAAEEHVLLLTLHHIVSDGWSMNVLIDEFIRFYDAHERQEAPQLPALPIQYSDYALWQRRWLEAGEQARQLEYWQAQLGDEHPVLELPTDHPRPALPSYRGTRYDFAIEPALAEQLRATARQHNVTLFMLLLGAFNVLLHRYTGQGDIRIGVPIANRNRAEVEGLIGFFVNTQVLRTQLNGQTPVSELLQQVKEAALGAQVHQDLPFEQLVEALKLERSLSHTPLFQVMYNHQPQVADISAVSTASGLELGLVEWQSRTTQFDLTLDTFEKSGKLQAALTYANDLFDAATIERMAQHWTRLLQAMVADTAQRVGELPMLAAVEQQQLLLEWNQTEVRYPVERCLHQLIEEQVQRTPQASALVFAERELSYAQLDARANQLAHLLREQGVGPDVLVGICVERSIEMVVGLLAILKAGGAYVPLDPEYPLDRLAYMIEDSGIALLLTQSALLPVLPTEAVKVMILDQDQDWLDGYSEAPLAPASGPLNLAYVIYTSGSTGKPKGAGNSHAALVNRLCWMQDAYGLDGSDAVLQKTPFSFDVSVWEFFWPLLTGARLVVAAPGAHREPALLIETITKHGISTLHFVPSMLQAFIHEPGVQACASLKRIVCSGEALPLDAQQQVFAKLPAACLYNLYGPTEAAIDVTHWTCVDEGASSVPIGRPIANLRTYVLDAELSPVPAGVAGELYLGGAGLARSYHRRPGLTAERFVTSPFEAGTRLYRTGDRVRQRADGVIEYLGRLDHQVKLRGLRIELGEIETRLMQHPLVREAVVLVQGGKQLVGYLVLEDAAPAATWQQVLKAWLLDSLPEYMVPAYLMPLAKLPVTANGKLDRKALPLPEAASQQAFIAPEDATQKALAAIWCDVLGLEQVGLEDNFFELGGDSIISIQVVSRARQAGIRLSPRDLFQYQTVRSLALAAVFESQGVIDQGPASGELALTPVQHWFMEQPVPQRHHWNQSLLLQARQPLDGERLAQALTRLAAHHDALRLRVRQTESGWQQAYAEAVDELLWQRDAANAEQLSELCEAAQRSLDLEQGPLLRGLLVNLADDSQRLLLVIHHWAVDGVSWRVLLEDLQQLYTQPEQALALHTSSYQAWSAHLQDAAAERGAELDYWQAQIPTQVAELPVDRPGAALEKRHEQKITLTLDAERTGQLLQQAPSAYRTQINDLLLTALARTLGRWTGAEGTLVQLEGHGRETLGSDLDLSRSVGWFTSLFPVYLRPATEPGAAIKAIKEQLRAVPDKGLGFGLLRYLGDDASREAMAQLAQPRVTFNYLGQFDRQFDAEALLVPATEKAGQTQDPLAPLANWLVIEGQVYGGQLSLSWGFSREMFETATVQRLVDDYRQELLALIEHCLDPRHGGLTPADVSLARLTQQQLDDLALPSREVQDLYPLSPMQQGMLFHSLYQQDQGDVYVSQLRADVQGLDVAQFQRAWEQVLARHDMLRTGFVWQDDQGQALQVVHRQVTLPFIEYDWRERQDLPAALDALAVEQHRQGFELARPPLLRVVLVRTAEDRWHLLYTSHHILMDGWSNALVLNEVLQACKGQALPPVGAGFSQHIAWLQRQDPALGEAFWRGRLAQLDEPSHLARSVAKGPAQPALGEHGEWLCELDEAQTARLNAFARAHQVTLNSLVQSAWLLLLQRYTGQASVACGVTVSGRPAELADVEQQVGLFINTLPLIVSAPPSQSVSAWVRTVQALNLEMREHEHTPLFDIQRWAGSAGEALFDTLVVFENFPVAKSLEQASEAGLRFSGVSSQERTNYPLTLTVHGGQRLSLNLEYLRADFDEAAVQRLAAYLLALLQRFVEAPEQALGALPLLLEHEQQRMLEDWNPAQASQPAQASVLQRFEQQAAAQPENVALILDQRRMSYAELNLRANRLAHRLIELGVGPDTLVGVAVDRSLEMIVGLLAVLKAGGAYVPLDPQYPRERLQCMIEDSGLRLLLTQQALLEQLPISQDLNLVCLEQDPHWLADYSGQNPAPRAQPGNLAYVMFTSGSTGRPKGVGIDQASLARHVEVVIELFELKAHDRALQFGTFNFDGFVEQLYPALCCGAGVVVRGGELWDSDTFYQQLIEHQISVLDLTTAYWYLLVRDFADRGPRDYGRLRQVHIGGEAMPPEGLNAWRDAGLGHVRLLNTYGPTEATVTATALDCAGYVDGREPLPPVMPIGRVLDGRAIYLLDANLNPVPVGVAGELVIGGPLLARGYFNRPDLTAHRFIPDPFAADGAGRLYRTGDLARYRADGVIEYVGRIDHQVKVRGFRIELGEIEARLLAQASVREALVIAADNQLVAYVVASQPLPEAEQGGLREQLKATLREELPDYMVPAHILFLEHLPLSPNGKLDRSALPKPDASQSLADWVAPVSEREQQVAAIWSEVLGAERVGLNDQFFAMGGHSLLATQMVSRVRHGLGIEVALKTLFEQPVLGDFVRALGTVEASAPAISPVDRDQPLALSYAQERQWFLWQLDPQSAAYHVPSALRLKGRLDVAALQRSFDTLVARHESLRTHLQQDGERTLQVIAAQARIDLTLVEADEARLKTLVEAEITRPFDLRQGPLLRVSLLRLAEDEHVLVLVQHHIVSDGWSMQVMVDELVQLYAAYSQGQALQLPAMPIQYVDYALWQRQWMEAGEKPRQLNYWRQLLGGEQPVLELPFDHQRPALPSHRGARLNVALDATLVSNLKQLAQAQGVTLFMLLLASYQTLLHRYSGQEDIRVGVPIANRNRVETERLIGFFVNTQVLKADIDEQLTVAQLLQQVKQRALEAQAHQDLPFEQLVEALQPERSLSLSPLFQVVFNHHISLTDSQLQRLPQLEMSPVSWDEGAAQFDLTLDIEESGDQLRASLSYATDLFKASTIERMARHWRNLLQAMVADQQQSIGQLNLLDSAEQQQILTLWDRTDSGFSAKRLVHELVADRARENPEAVAVIFGEQQLTFGELERSANRLARALIARGVGPEVRVAIAMPRSAEIMVAFLAVLKAGGVYVPLDVEYPRDRLLYMMQDSRAKLLLTHTAVSQQLPIPDGLDSLAVDRTQDWAGEDGSEPNVALDGDNLAYVIYTSGSTGMPKGVAVSHGPLVAHIIATGERYEMTPADCELHFMSFAFDGSHEGWMHPLINGARVLIRDDSLWLPEHTYAQMHRHGVTVGVFPPVYLQQLAEHAERDGNPPAVRVYCFGGDAVAQSSYDLAWRALRPTYLFNGYGPTETVVTPLLWKAHKGDPCGAAYAPIGELLGNRSGYVLDAQLNLQPIGVAGELYLGGEGVARGYLERPALTAERFVPDPFGAPGGRVYRSGDLTRGRVDGVVDYLGRVDHQVKVRGFRIELGEIEARLREQDSVREAVVVAQDGPTGKQLVGYVVALDPRVAADAASQAAHRETLRRALRARLPDYMVPAHLLFLEQMPLTPNGKLDRKGLPQPDASLMQQTYVAPQSELEQQIAAIWAEILRLPRVGLNDNFFEVGGHSLLAIQITSRVQAELGLEVPLAELFQTESLLAYAQAAAGCRAGSAADFDDLREFLSELEAI
ncbi:Non-ribosomal peptide synthetase [Pseudomonas chlororaphis subsp. piscium]|uniref:non-ribosomal peptide synthase/polyketide synthase n=1 Tax=Pseudomonas chlororaphis TaxID=587753 RepID=UPI0006A5E80D|nr:non-ribosomal peptide synthase/polyketide synthase [Pseudomonas chlororaphis]AZC32355.1 Non-ribosomal peptide synthetase [Pseudomonas chlororaphis subsp. piscium]WDG90073.1 non-ribosomal peptide synthase/polyketide synthase [Pseudomonas chlororaphis]SDS66749.1 non-ribosomal peptide synthase domain TIGR01720/amino acid adenylation domain-containing protein [Pseudomonas chlororaphis]